jgi:hypothetical protein
VLVGEDQQRLRSFSNEVLHQCGVSAEPLGDRVRRSVADPKPYDLGRGSAHGGELLKALVQFPRANPLDIPIHPRPSGTHHRLPGASHTDRRRRVPTLAR